MTKDTCLDKNILDAKNSDQAMKLLNQNLGSSTSDMINEIFKGTQIEDLTQKITNYYSLNNEDIDIAKTRNLKALWDQSVFDVNLADIRAIIAARTYLKNEGDSRWGQWVTEQITSDWEKLSTDISKSIISVQNTFDNMNQAYINENELLQDTQNLLNIKNEEFNKIIKNIREYEKLENVDIRKIYYQFADKEVYDNIKYYIQIVYYAIFVIYIFFGDFMSKKDIRITDFI